MSVRIIIGDVMDGLKKLPDESVQCVVTSPPYWGLRDYGVDGQIGLEPTLGEHIDVMVRVFREVRRVLRKDGTLWLNYGDCYATTPNGRSAADTKAKGNDDRTFRDKPFSTIGAIYVEGHEKGDRRGHNAQAMQYSHTGHGAHTGRIVSGGYLKPKDLCMVPNRLAIALQEDGWWVRSEIIWAKPNPMPESISDRPATSHEKIFLLSKSARYFYDSDAVRTPSSCSPTNTKMPDGWDSGPCPHGSVHRLGREKGVKVKKDKTRGSTPRHKDHTQHTTLDETQRGFGHNLRNVWTIATRPFSEAHFATFPPALIEPCIKAGCPQDGIVLDPFGGAGTTGLVANRLHRRAILIELNPEYSELARRRIEEDGGLFVDVEMSVSRRSNGAGSIIKATA